MRARSTALPNRIRTGLLLAAITLLTAVHFATAPPARAADGEGEGFVQTNLVSDLAMPGVTQDDHLKNPWGIVHGPTTPWWVSDNNGNVSTLYNGAGQKYPPPPASPLVVDIPAPSGFNASSRFHHR